MKLSMIAAMARGRVIGKDNDMPWHMPADLAHFKRVTLGKPVLMGRKTYESIGRALPGRRNVVISRDSSYTLADAEVVNDIDTALTLVANEDEVMIIGGGAIYAALLPRADRLYLTHIALDVDGDTHFPDYQAVATWACVEQEHHEADDKNPYAYRFETLERQR
ncbi:type 3 dihydrofolate reductase [Aestuariibacter halophilus]|uniref:Dihydrofolate reductase n=1 Tax=Fluctibacter halophilus TaxID=226011 RepID=A0ABS8GC56_9ALTE|nr:type 3 dihydrofolate reductase [Aestuariibacter halophilus]MCC2617989.1 type 3 dihydrofolate reductase [Aestuariibacter halophilus]